VTYRLLRSAAAAFTLLILASCGDSTTETETAGDTPPAALAAAANSWITRADLPSTERWALAAATVTNAAGQSILYTIGGRTATGGSLSKVQAYNVATNSWSYKASLPVPLYWSNGAGVINRKIYISGGLTGYKAYSAALYVYDPAANSWTRKHDMPNTTFRGVTGVIDGKLYVLTGCDQEDCDRYEPRAFYRYNPVTDRWVSLPTPTSQVGGRMGGVMGKKFYVTGGGNQLDMYDPATNLWAARAPMPQQHSRGAAAALAGKLYVTGGYQEEPDGTIESVLTTSVYDPTTNTWATRAPMPTAHSDFAASRVVFNGRPRIEVVGGTRPGNNLQYIP